MPRDHLKTILLGAILLTGLREANGQAIVGPSPNRTVNLNYVYAAELGFGGYALDGLSADVYTLPLAYTLHGAPIDGWSLKLLAPIQGGLYSFRATDTDGRRISINQQSLAIVPGAELQIPIGDHFMLKPFVQGGVAHAFGDDVGNPDSWVFLGGARSVAQWRAGAYTLSLGNGVVYAGDHTMGPGFSEHYVALQAGIELRRPLGFSIGSFTPDVGVFAAEYYYPAPMEFSRFLKPVLRISNQNEIGFSIGSATPFQMLGVSQPRLGAGFVFGGGLDVYHVNFGFPF